MVGNPFIYFKNSQQHWIVNKTKVKLNYSFDVLLRSLLGIILLKDSSYSANTGMFPLLLYQCDASIAVTAMTTPEFLWTCSTLMPRNSGVGRIQQREEGRILNSQIIFAEVPTTRSFQYAREPLISWHHYISLASQKASLKSGLSGTSWTETVSFYYLHNRTSCSAQMALSVPL